MPSQVTKEMLDSALTWQKKRPENLIIHSNQGSQLTSYDFTEYYIKNKCKVGIKQVVDMMMQ